MKKIKQEPKSGVSSSLALCSRIGGFEDSRIRGFYEDIDGERYTSCKFRTE